MHNFKLQKFET